MGGTRGGRSGELGRDCHSAILMTPDTETMHPNLSHKLPALYVLCQAHGVRSLHAFGSVTRADYDPARSDIDLIVDFIDPDLGPWMRRFFEFQRATEALLGRPIDLHPLSAVSNSRLGATIQSSKVPLYAAA